MEGSIIALIVAMGLGWPVWLTMVIVRHREKMRLMEHQQQGSPGLVEEVRALRQELTQLRETTTRFDMSFDASLDRLERRMDSADPHSQTTDAYPAAASYGAAEPAQPLRRS